MSLSLVLSRIAELNVILATAPPRSAPPGEGSSRTIEASSSDKVSRVSHGRGDGVGFVRVGP